MRVLVTGGQGMLARDLTPELTRRGHEVTALDVEELDITDERAVVECLEGLKPQAVVQCAAYTAVDRAETDAETAFRVNVDGTRHVARACQKMDALFVYPSTDYVFDGTATAPIGVDHPTEPINVYGRSKLAGEEAAREAGRAVVLRTSWLYGAGGLNFVDTIRRLARERSALDVVDDQVGRPTWTVSLSEVIGELLKADVVGTFHATDGGEAVSWHGFATEIVARDGQATVVRPVPSTAFPRPAARPAYSVLDLSATERVLRRPMVEWRDALARYLASTAGPG